MYRPLRSKDLETAIDALVASYDSDNEINNLESASLPNRRQVLEAYHHLVPALLMGYYATRQLDRDNLRYSISEMLYPAYEILVEQIRRAITYQQQRGRMPPCADGWCEQVVIDLFNQLPALRQTLSGDVQAAFDGDPAVQSIEEVIFSVPGLRAITAHRVAHILFKSRVPMIPRILAENAHSDTGIDIHPGASIGERFFIDHGTGVVIGETAVIGNNVKLYQDVTLGALSVRRTPRSTPCGSEKRHPTIEDDVTIYAGAKILGGNTVIGAGSVIGANAWLLSSVPPNTRIMGGESATPPPDNTR